MSQHIDSLNSEQKKAVLQTEGPVLILAGAGSGKTRVITHRIAYLIDECGVAPWNIMAITFTNKAAGEMKDRVDRIVGGGSESIWVSTFHSSCARILRRFADRIGYGNNYSIYDSDDSRQLIKGIIKKHGLDTQKFSYRDVMGAISRAKNNGLDAMAFTKSAEGDWYKSVIADLFRDYEKELKKADSMDFDDLLLNAVKLFKTDSEVLENYRNRFRYIMVDEYQDTNDVQFEFVKLLADRERNLCVVGDDDQSIYRFRGANIRNILNFEEHFPEACVIRLEQNYRSTGIILDAANAVISHNKNRKEKKLWTDAGRGELLRLLEFDGAPDEADFIARDISKRKRDKGADFGDFAVLYRSNYQSRLIEERFVRESIPYNLVGGTNFYARREIKDLLAYLKTVDSGADDQTTRRIINVPRRGIGATTISRVQEYADSEGISFLRACSQADEILSLSKAAASKCIAFADMIRLFRTWQKNYSLTVLTQHIIENIGYEEYLKSADADDDPEDDGENRIDNVYELIAKITDYEEKEDEPSLSGFLTDVALVAEIDQLQAGSRVLLMTMHSAKGLEFDHVYIAGMEEGVFPSYQSVENEDTDPAAIEEERRLAYVGITRAKKTLTLTWSHCRMVRGEFQYMDLSRFAEEIPGEYIEVSEKRDIEKSVFSSGSIPSANKQSYVSTQRTTTVSPGYSAPRKSSYTGYSPGNRARAVPAKKPFIAGAARQQDSAVGKAKTQTWGMMTKGAPAPDEPDYRPGDRVKHVKYGDGTVSAMTREEKDYKVTVEFDSAGQKIMYAAFAKLQKL